MTSWWCCKVPGSLVTGSPERNTHTGMASWSRGRQWQEAMVISRWGRWCFWSEMVQAEDARWGCRWCWYWTKHQTSNITTWTKHQTSTRVDREKEESMTAAVGFSLAVDWLMSVGRWWWSSGCSVVVMVKAGAAGSWSRKGREKEMSWWRSGSSLLPSSSLVMVLVGLDLKKEGLGREALSQGKRIARRWGRREAGDLFYVFFFFNQRKT